MHSVSPLLFMSCCIGGAEETTDRHGLYLSAYVTGGEADGRNTTLLQKTRVVTQTQNPSWRQKLGPVRVHSKTGALRLSIRQTAAPASADGTARRSYVGDHHVGTIQVPLTAITRLSPSCMPQTVQVPLYSHFSKLGKSRGSSQNGGFEPVTAADGEHDDTHTHCVYDPFTKATMGTHGRELRGTVTIQLRFIVQPSAVAPAEAAAPTSKSQTLNNKVKKLEHVPSGFHPTLFVPPTLPPITFDDDSSAGSATDPYMFPCVSGVQYKDVSVAGTPAPPSPLLPSILTTHNHTSSGGGAAVRRTEVPASPRLGTQTSAVKDLVNTEAMGASVRLARGLVSAVVMLWKEGLLDPDPASTTSLDLGPAADATASPKASALLSLAVVQLQDSFTSKFVKQSARAATSGTQTAVKVEGAGAGAGLGLGVGVGLGSAAGSTVAGVGQPLTKLTYVLKADAVRQPRQTWVLAEGPAAAASGRAAKLAKPTHRKTASKARTGDGGQGWDLAAIMLASTSFGSRPPIAPVAAKGLPSPFANSSAAGGKASSSQAPPSRISTTQCEEASVVQLLASCGLPQLYAGLLELYNRPIPGADASPKVDEILPGGVYWSLLSAAADLTRIRPQNLRLCLLTVVLECWTPRFRAIETARQVVAPLQVAADARLLTKMEATLYTQASGALLQKCIDILERHYELYESCVVHGTACLGSLMGVMQSVVTASSGPEVTARMMRIHLSAAVEKRMRALLHPSSSSIASSVEVLNSNHPDHLVSLASFRESGQPPPPPPPQQPSKADANHRNESAHVASWLAHMISSASQPSHAAPAHGVSSGNIAGGEAVPPRSSVTHRRNQSVTDALKAGGGGGGEGSIDISHLIVAVLVMLDDTEHDLMLQSMFAEYLNLPLFTTNVRYKLLSEQLRQTFDGRATVTFSEVVFQLQEQVTALATLLDTHGLAVSSSSSSSSNPEPDFRISPAPAPHPHPLQPNHSSKNIAVHSYTPGPPLLQSTSDSAPLPHLYAQSASPFSNPHAPPACTAPTSTDLKVELVDVCALFQPSVDLFIRNLGKRLLEWVDLTVSAEMSRAEGSRWAPVSLQERSFYSFSVVDLYFHLQTVLESVCKKVMRYGSAQQNANTARELHQVIAKAVQRYINHAEQLSLQKVSRDSQWEPLVLTNLVQLGTDAASPPPNASGKTSTPSTPPHDGARSQPAGSAIFPHSSKEQPPAAHARAGAAQRALTGPNGGVGGPGGTRQAEPGGSPHHGSSSGVNPGAQGCADAWLHRAAVTSELGAAAAVVEVKPVTSTLQVCVLLNNMEQVVQQQRQLEKMLIRAARGGGDVEAMYSPSAGTASPSEQSPPKADANGGHSTRPSRATHHTPGGGSSHPAAASHRMRAAGASASFRLRGGAERHMRRSVGSSNGSSVAGGAGQYPDDHPSWSKLPHSAGKRHAHGTHTEMDDGLDAVSEDSTVSEMTEEGDSSDEEDDDEAGRMGGRHQSQEDVGDDSDALRWKSAYTRGEVASRTSTRKSLNVHSEVFGDESERLSRIVHLSIHGIMQHVGAQMQRKVIAALTAILNNLGHASASRGAGVAEQRGVAGGAAATAVVTPRAASKLRKAPTAAPHGPTAGAAAGSGVASAGHLPEDIEVSERQAAGQTRGEPCVSQQVNCHLGLGAVSGIASNKEGLLPDPDSQDPGGTATGPPRFTPPHPTLLTLKPTGFPLSTQPQEETTVTDPKTGMHTRTGDALPTRSLLTTWGGISRRHRVTPATAELDLLSAALSGDLSLIRHYLSPSLLRKTLSCCWDYALGGIRRLALGQASYRPLRPPELRVMEAALKQLMSDFHADGSGLPVEMLQHRARPKQHLLQLAAQDTESLIRDYTSLTDDIILDPKMATSHPYRNAARKLLQPAAGIDDRNGTPRHPSTDVVPLDIIRLLLQRPGDRLASQYWEKHAASAQDSVMQMVFGLPPAETVVVFAGCRLSSCHQEGMVYLTSSYLAFTTLFKDKDVKAKSVAPGKPSTMGKLLMMMGAGSAGADDGYQPDTTLLISLRDVERLDSTFQASGQALTLTMLSRTAHVLYGFEAHVRDQLIQAIRLHVMGTDTCLDRCLRGLEGTQGALAMALPAGEAIVASFPCSKYAVLQPIPGVLYLCTSRLVFDSANSRQTILYSDLTSLKRTKDWRGGVWMLLQHQAVAATGASAGRDGAAGGAGRQGSVSSVGPPAPPQVLQVGNGTEELATDMLQSIASLSK
ncbi:MAG: hypothetical protein WDW38_005601 [Sanguina aurantia]